MKVRDRNTGKVYEVITRNGEYFIMEDGRKEEIVPVVKGCEDVFERM